jgi:outer membrane protein assembly factor BamA
LLDWFSRAAHPALAALALVAIAVPALGSPVPRRAVAQAPTTARTPAPSPTATPQLPPLPSAAPSVPVPGPTQSAPAPAQSAPAQGAPAQAAPKVVSVSVEGNAHVPSDRILGVVRTKVGDPFDARVVEEDLRAINDLGFFSDLAPPVIRQLPDGIAITFRVVENPVVTAIRFTGNETVPSDTLLALMDTGTGQVFNLRTYQQDVLKLNSYYDRIGFGGQLPSHVVDVNIDQSGVLTLHIQEGLIVRRIVIVGPPQADPALPADTIVRALVTKEGRVYSDTLRDQDVERLKDLYKQHDLSIGDFEAGIDPATVDLKAGTADVRYSISVARVGAVEITGNTKTHDDVIRRELRLKPGAVITESAVRNDYNRLNNLGFFEKVDIATNPGPDPKRPAYLTLKWSLKEQRTGTAQLGAGYSGGVTGTGLTGNVSYSENNINGTGNGGSIRLERGSRVADAQLSFSVPYLGKTERSQKYSLGTTIFIQSQTNFYPVYLATPVPAPGITPTPIPAGAPVPVSIVPTDPLNYNVIGGIASTYESASSGLSATLGRRLSDFVRTSLGVNIQTVKANATVPAPYFFPTQTSTLTPVVNASTTPFVGSSTNLSTAYGIVAPSLAVINNSQPYALRSFVLGVAADTRDDVQNPRHGWNSSIAGEVSSPSFGSAFNYTITTVDAARFFPVLRNSTLGLHARVGTSTGAIPPNKLFTFSDQELRGYRDPFYGTDILLFQGELRVPLSPDRKITLVGLFDSGGTRIRGGQQVNSDATTTDLNGFVFHSDFGIGVRFDVPQLGLRTIRLDFARGSQGSHVSFGIGQAF